MASVAKKVLGPVAASFAAAFLMLVPAVPASASVSALSGLSLGCTFVGVPTQSGNCVNPPYAAGRVADFQVLGGGSGSYTYAWTVSPSATPITGGCTSTTNYCGVRLTENNDDYATVTVVVTQGGVQSPALTASATYMPVCGRSYC